ncbi:MAG: hypothetical protein D6730_05090 [Bacteroidetes bacterium]|nr:MAG: hypothetical protein D6730_05090 [Bacteroidota bacterium]
MKHSITIFFLLALIWSIQAQNKLTHELAGYFEFAHIGQGFALSYKGNLKRHAVILGIRYHQNTIVKDDQRHVFKNRFYARNFRERLGLNLGYHFSFPLKHSDIHPFLFYNLQIAHMGTKSQVYWAYGTLNGQRVYVKGSMDLLPMTSIDNIIGLGFSARLYKQVHLYIQAGGGIVDFAHVDPRLFVAGPDLPLLGSTWELSSRFSFGLSYAFFK